MTVKHSLLILPLLAALTGPTLAEERAHHFVGKPADTLEQAVTNFTAGNQELQALLNGDLSNEDLGQIHMLSYTLENALGKLNEEMKVLSVLLEQVHLASETGKNQVLKGSGKAYMEIVDTLELGK